MLGIEKASGILNHVVDKYIIFWDDWSPLSQKLLLVVILMTVIAWFGFKLEYEEIKRYESLD